MTEKSSSTSTRVDLSEVKDIASAGYYIALRVGFSSPVEELNNLPPEWIRHYTRQRLMLFDPVVRWVYENTGTIKWSDLKEQDPKGILGQAQTFGMRFGIAVSVFDGNAEGRRSFGYFTRSDREFSDIETKLLYTYLGRRHVEMSPPTNLTAAEIEALRLVKDGMRLKEVAHTLGVTEGAIKQRIKNAKAKLNANTSSQAATIAAQHGIV